VKLEDELRYEVPQQQQKHQKRGGTLSVSPLFWLNLDLA